MPGLQSEHPIRRSWILAIALTTVFFIYVASFVGVVGSNDGSHYALTYAMVERGSFRVDGLHWPSEDVATDRFPIPVPAKGPADSGPGQIPRLPGEHFYSNKPPGTAVLAIPFYCLGRVLEPWLKRYPPPATAQGRGRFPHDWIRMEIPFFAEARAVGYAKELGRDEALAQLRQSYMDEWQRQNCVNLLPALLGVLCTWLLYRLCRHVGAGFWPALLTALLVAVGTIQWRYATVLFSHMPTTASLLVLIDGLAAGWAWRRGATIAWGFAAGLLIATQYQAALFLPFLAGFWWWKGRGILGAHRPAWAAMAGLGAAVPFVLLAAYQWSCFGSPLVNPVSRSRYFPYAGSVREMLSGAPKEAAVNLLIQDPDAGPIREAAQRQPRGGAAPVRRARFVQFPLLAEPTGWRVTESLRQKLLEWLDGPQKQRTRTGRLQGAGLLLVSPFLGLAVLGWLVFGWHAKGPAGLLALLALAQVAFIAFVREPTGGATYDARYLMAVLPLIAVGFALTLDRITRLGSTDTTRPARYSWVCVRWLLYVPLTVLALLSVTNMIHSMAVFQRHEIGLWLQGRYWIDWHTRLASCFQSAGNWPLLALAAAIVALGALGTLATRRVTSK